ncbi:zinc-dependent metalloprotease [Zhouia amylolytica]|uniref:Peptidase n=1 Tax=Zhouia amylolytica AD3 TaxID=1286632 RepID=W2UN02_9FLAO|nr:zinc-dependent metalloprotease [Zhouia amylolytica]ETN95373.1 hypothetical protein P278_10950 [Zhouia amylolytica AD3]
MYKKFVLAALIFINYTNAQFLEKKNDLEKQEGFFNIYYQPSEDKIFLEVDKLEEEFLYVNSLSSGVGSNDLGLDRGQLGGEQVVLFKKAGNKLLLIQPNLKYRANSDNDLEVKSVEQAFAKSVLFGFEIKEHEGKSYIIDFTPFLLRDAHGVAKKLKDNDQGTYKLDLSKSALYMARTKAFVENNEFEAMLTFNGEAKGNYIRSVSPNSDFVTVVQHHSFIKLPDNQYKPRVFDPRSGSFSISYMDYATPVFEPIQKRYITRHRLEKKNPELPMSEPIEPIIYYLDNGTPEPIRSALLDGASWWNQAFEAIGFKNAFQVKVLPEDADPMDVRYNVIQWVHRSTRGWSYGASVKDPRTGEIIKGHVSLGSLRIRQDFLIAQALMNKPFEKDDDNYEPMLALALARIRQLAAHEVGHTLGFAHNFAASALDRASVMDYPHPQFSVKDGHVDFSKAYETGIGEWDKVTVAYSYSMFSDSINENKALSKILRNAFEEGHQFISDNDARAKGGAHPNAHLWDNGPSAAEELKNVLAVRQAAIENFTSDNIRTGEPFTVLEDVFVPLYFFHRYQTEAVIKVIGGVDYNYAVKGGNQKVVEEVDVAIQNEALKVLLQTIDPKTLMIPENILNLFPPRAYGFNRSRESFKSHNGVTFDPIAAAETASDFTLSLLFHPERANRLLQQAALNSNQLGLEDLIDIILQSTIENPYRSGYEGEVQKIINYNVVKSLIRLSVNKNTSPGVKATTDFKLKRLKTWLERRKKDSFASFLATEINIYFKEPQKYQLFQTPKIPDGSPIGVDCLMN